jgi:hypothetical protein
VPRANDAVHRQLMRELGLLPAEPKRYQTSEEDRERWRREYEEEVARRLARVRTPPLPPWMQGGKLPQGYYRQGRGYCRWCREPIFREDGSLNTRLSWHHVGCLRDYKIIADPGVARAAILDASRGVCCDCGSSIWFTERGREGEPGDIVAARWEQKERDPERPKRAPGWRQVYDYAEGPYQLIAFRQRPWQCEHDVPLWSVNKEEPDALRYWTLWNLRLRCDDCHKRKSAAEAAQRAKEKRLREKAKPKHERLSRKGGPRRPTIPF